MTDTSYDGGIAGATQFNQYAAMQKTAYDQAKLRLNDQRNSFLQQSGLGGTFNDKGEFTGITHLGGDDAYYGGYQTMNRGLGQQGEENDAAISGMGFGGGLANQARESAQRDYSQQSGDFSMGVGDTLKQVGADEQSMTTDYQNDLQQKFLDMVRQDIADGNFNPADYSGITIPGYGTPELPNLPPASGTAGTPAGGGDHWTPPGPGGTGTAGGGQGKKGVKTSKYGHFNAKGYWVPWKRGK